MQFLCEFFVRWCFHILFFIVHLLFLSFQVRCLLSYTASFLRPWGKVLGLDLTGDRYPQISLSAPSQITCHSAFSLREVGSVRSEVLPFVLESKLPKGHQPFLSLIVYSGKKLAEGGSWSTGNWRFGDPECFLSKHLVSLLISRHPCQHGLWLYCLLKCVSSISHFGSP